MTNWKARVKIKHLLTDDESPEAVRACMTSIAEVIEAAPAFRKFNTGRFRVIPDGNGIMSECDFANQLLDELYDYADELRIWIE